MGHSEEVHGPPIGTVRSDGRPHPAGLVRQDDGASQYRVREFLGVHRLGDEEPLNHVEAEVARALEFGARFHPFGNGTNAIFLRDFDDSATYELLQTIVRATCDELSVDLDLDKGKLSERRE